MVVVFAGAVDAGLVSGWACAVASNGATQHTPISAKAAVEIGAFNLNNLDFIMVSLMMMSVPSGDGLLLHHGNHPPSGRRHGFRPCWRNRATGWHAHCCRSCRYRHKRCDCLRWDCWEHAGCRRGRRLHRDWSSYCRHWRPRDFRYWRPRDWLCHGFRRWRRHDWPYHAYPRWAAGALDSGAHWPGGFASSHRE